MCMGYNFLYIFFKAFLSCCRVLPMHNFSDVGLCGSWVHTQARCDSEPLSCDVTEWVIDVNHKYILICEVILFCKYVVPFLSSTRTFLWTCRKSVISSIFFIVLVRIENTDFLLVIQDKQLVTWHNLTVKIHWALLHALAQCYWFRFCYLHSASLYRVCTISLCKMLHLLKYYFIFIRYLSIEHLHEKRLKMWKMSISTHWTVMNIFLQFIVTKFSQR